MPYFISQAPKLDKGYLPLSGNLGLVITHHLNYVSSDLQKLKTLKRKTDSQNSKPPFRKEGSFPNERNVGLSPKYTNTLNICLATEYLK